MSRRLAGPGSRSGLDPTPEGRVTGSSADATHAITYWMPTSEHHSDVHLQGLASEVLPALLGR